jgi:zinc protease
MTNDRPVGGVSIRLRFDVGSYEEPEADRGVAHFLEHMAFNGTRNIPEGELARRFAHAGVAFGRDQNASTSMFGTTYDLDLPRSDPEALDLAFNWLRDIGDGLLLTPEAVAREQGVILAEHNTRLGPAKDWSDAYQAFAAPNARSRSRLPIGTPETIRTLDAAALSRFHRTWYRPDNAVLIVVGDLPLNALEARVRRTFADWQAPAEPLVRIEATLFDQERPLAVFAYPETTLVTGITACRLSPWKTLGPDTRERRRTFALRSLWIGALNRRLQLLSQGADAPFASASVANSPWVRESDALCVNVSPPVAGDWRAAFSAALIEIRRLEAHGLEAGEISRIVKAQQRSNTTGVRQAGDRYSSVLAQGLLGLFPLHGFDPGAFTRPRDVPAIYNSVVAGIAPADIQADFVRAWSGSAPLIAVRMAEPPTEDEVVAVWNTVMQAPAPEARPIADPLGDWAYDDFGEPGRIASREVLANPAFTRVRFENGVVLNVKSVAYTRSLVQIAVEMGGGRAAVPDADFQAASLGSAFVQPGGLGQHSQREIQDLFPDRRLGVGVRMLNDVFQLYASSPPLDTELQLQMMAALVSDPGFRDDFPGQRRQMIDAVYRAYRTQPFSVLNIAVGEAISPGNPRFLPPREKMDAVTMADIERLYRPVLTEAPLEVTLVGDMPEHRMIELVAATFGALPPRTAVPNPNHAYVMRYGDARPHVEAFHEGPVDQAALTALWPLFVSEPGRRREQRAIELLQVILQERIRDEVREALGAAYSPNVGLRFEDGGDDGVLSVNIITSPADVTRVMEAIRRVVAEAAAGQITQAELDDARTPILARIADSRASTGWWYGVMNGSAREPQKLRDAVDWEGDYRSMTLDELKQAAATWLSGAAIEGVALPTPRPPA